MYVAKGGVDALLMVWLELCAIYLFGYLVILLSCYLPGELG